MSLIKTQEALFPSAGNFYPNPPPEKNSTWVTRNSVGYRVRQNKGGPKCQSAFNGVSSDTAYESQRHCPLIPAFFLEGGEI